MDPSSSAHNANMPLNDSLPEVNFNILGLPDDGREKDVSYTEIYWTNKGMKVGINETFFAEDASNERNVSAIDIRNYSYY